MPSADATGPLTITSTAHGWVVVWTAYRLNGSCATARIAASTTGACSGRQPAITALTATFSTVASAHVGGSAATTSPAGRPAVRTNAATRSGVGGTTGSPSPQPRRSISSWNASGSAGTSTRVDARSPLTSRPA